MLVPTVELMPLKLQTILGRRRCRGTDWPPPGEQARRNDRRVRVGICWLHLGRSNDSYRVIDSTRLVTAMGRKRRSSRRRAERPVSGGQSAAPDVGFGSL